VVFLPGSSIISAVCASDFIGEFDDGSDHGCACEFAKKKPRGYEPRGLQGYRKTDQNFTTTLAQ
jgi:hypothetical protein